MVLFLDVQPHHTVLRVRRVEAVRLGEGGKRQARVGALTSTAVWVGFHLQPKAAGGAQVKLEQNKQSQFCSCKYS